MAYALWLVGLSLLFIILERTWPRFSDQRTIRRGLGVDLFYLVFNGHFLGIIIGWIGTRFVIALDAAVGWLNVRAVLHAGVIADAPYWMQFLVALFTIDLLHWLVHNLLHRLPFLWEFHRVHHSIVDIDWLGGMRFHWMEAAIYNGLTYLLLSLFGFAWPALFWYGIFSTFMGFFNHSNLRWRIGSLKYFLNNPEMHVWHHVHPDAGPFNRNFGINLSLWDWLFGTAYLPEREPPRRLGFYGIEQFPGNLLRQIAYPLIGWKLPKSA